ncbi:hypothetical protein FDO65_05895 [Nakamurella flava]|uniref:Uncharacterized protein n=1 Tax=Nakamurella flava TaxID=2576308 RepID=A0A4U6QM66_9ACTN|nr:hypothetical protein [Nakamurella flava]TKV61162.1 hypothetical protein FDO65_05895 [Nakamurella flava]
MLTVLAAAAPTLHDTVSHVTAGLPDPFGAVLHQLSTAAPAATDAAPPTVTVTVTVPTDVGAADDGSDDAAIELADGMSNGEIAWAIFVAIVSGGLVSLGPGLWVFLGILTSFLVTRAVTRFIRHRGATGAPATGPVKDIVIGGVHVHHQVFGIVTMFVTGLLALVTTPGDGVAGALLALVFGVGVGLAFDEFALWVHLDDVYWSDKGRKSIDAVAVVLVVAASARIVVDFALIGEGLDDAGDYVGWVWVLVAVVFGPALVCFLKGKWITGALGFLYPPLTWVGSLRLAKERSWWARHLYGRRRRARARVRHEGHERRMDRLRDLVGGSITPAAALSETVAEAIHAATTPVAQRPDAGGVPPGPGGPPTDRS